ncbi:MAG: 50S ribosomal protein L25 [Verrucomicrobia bacterium]|jgi:large subunit ribosomal protein L25|nr:50S ribosomal protein L25 [Verrucomicrobiota bacterium]MDA0905459.1 50S ribosomal protein L25 [Verrucomicrobiota bacterium]MDA1078145.1 50S ribosomal protein L25 [Verrucomicrobiota bacterium]
MSDITDSTLLVKSRDQHGSSISKKIRAEGSIPAVFYGKDTLKHYTVDDSQFRTLMRASGGSLSLLELDEGNGDKELALLKDMQIDSVKDSILHLDFVQVTRGQSLETKVPLELVGESPGVKNMAGILEFHQSEILVRCRPSQLPKNLTLDISQLELGGSLQLKDIPLPEGVELLGDLDSNIVTCVGSASGRAGAGDSEEEKATDETAAAEESSDTTENSGASE